MTVALFLHFLNTSKPVMLDIFVPTVLLSVLTLYQFISSEMYNPWSFRPLYDGTIQKIKLIDQTIQEIQ